MQFLSFFIIFLYLLRNTPTLQEKEKKDRKREEGEIIIALIISPLLFMFRAAFSRLHTSNYRYLYQVDLRLFIQLVKHQTIIASAIDADQNV